MTPEPDRAPHNRVRSVNPEALVRCRALLATNCRRLALEAPDRLAGHLYRIATAAER